MFNSTYGAGFRAGISPQQLVTREDGCKVLMAPVCPFSQWRCISRALWYSGYYDGDIARLTTARAA